LRENTEPADTRLARLAEVLTLVERLAGNPGAAIATWPDAATAYAAAGPIARRRFDALAAETAAFAAAGIEILLRRSETGGHGHQQAAARRLAQEMRAAIDELARLLHRPPQIA
jgi:hypothetical protein